MFKKVSRLSRLNIVVTILLLVVCFFWLYPFLWPIFSAFKTSDEMYRAGYRLWPVNWTPDNFVRAWSKAQFSRYLFNSIFYSVSTISLDLLILVSNRFNVLSRRSALIT